MTFVSIIIPFNISERYLKDCLDSIYDQNLDDSEVILILNGLSEDLSNLLGEFENKLNLIVKTFDEELNVSEARNEGLKIADGKYVYFIDSDDYLYKDALLKLVDVAKKTDSDFINGERYSTPFIRDRFEEELKKPSRDPLKKGDLSDAEFSFKLLVGQKTNSQEVVSILHALIKRDAFKDFRFDENKRYFSDYDFFKEGITNLKTFVGVEDAIYAKRNRDDSIHTPSLNQEPKTDSFLLYLEEYEKLASKLDELNDETYNILKDEIAASYLKYYLRNFSRFYKYNGGKWRKKYFFPFQKVSKDFKLDGLSFLEKQEVKALQNFKIKKLNYLINYRYNVKKLKKITSSSMQFKFFIYEKIYNKRPVKDNKILFISFFGKFYADSPKYLYEYLYENYNDKFEFVWVIDDKKTEIPGNPKKVKRFSLAYFKELAESKYWVTNSRQYIKLKKKKDQEIVSSWHGTPLKKLGYDIGNVYSKDPYTKDLYRRVARKWKYLLSPSQFVTDKYRSAFEYKGEIIQEGYPRNDNLYNASQSYIESIKNKLNIPKDKKVVLYAPTWRDDKVIDTGGIEFKLELDLDLMQEQLGDEYVVLIKVHYFVASKLNLEPYKGFVYDVSDYDDIADLYLISDIMITDYSSVFFDYANLKRPILFFTFDLDSYENVLRGFYIDIRHDLPGPLLFTTEEIIDSIKNIDKVNLEYQDKYEEFYSRFCYIDDGNASKRITDKIWGDKL